MTDDRSPMEALAPAIDLDLAAKLHDRQYRQKFFLAESAALIAEQLVALRKRRELNQKQVAEMAGTGQPAISRTEQANYQNWSFNTLRSLADVLDARLRVLIEAAEDVLPEYERPAESAVDHGGSQNIAKNNGVGVSAWNDFFPAGNQPAVPVNDDIPHNPLIAEQDSNQIDLRQPAPERQIA